MQSTCALIAFAHVADQFGKTNEIVDRGARRFPIRSKALRRHSLTAITVPGPGRAG